MAQPSTRALIMHFFTYIRVARVAYIVRYLWSQWGVAPGATREMLQRLVKERRITRVRRGVYQGT